MFDNLPSKDQFAAWLRARVDDTKRYDINHCRSCLLSRFLSEHYSLDVYVDIDCIKEVKAYYTHTQTPQWMFDFQCDCIFEPGWLVIESGGAYAERSLGGVIPRNNTEFTPAAALKILEARA